MTHIFMNQQNDQNGKLNVSARQIFQQISDGQGKGQGHIFTVYFRVFYRSYFSYGGYLGGRRWSGYIDFSYCTDNNNPHIMPQQASRIKEAHHVTLYKDLLELTTDISPIWKSALEPYSASVEINTQSRRGG